MSFNMHWHQREKMRDKFRKHVRDTALSLVIKPEGLAGIYKLLRECDVVSSRRDFARKAGVSSPTIDAWINDGENIDAKASTLRKISNFIMPHLQRLHGSDYSIEELADTLLGKGSGLRDELVDMLKGE
jgi:transcriptional regulator with XRE-family HTH domain